MADLFNIPGDKGFPWRFNKMVEYIANFPDEIGPVINGYLESVNATNNDKTWWVFLYSTCYCMGSAMVMYNELDYKTVTEQQIDKFWESHKPRLIFQSDRRYIKHMNQFPIIAKEFIKRSNRKPYDYIKQFVDLSDPEKTYNQLYKEIGTWRYYGRFSIILFIFNLCKVFPEINIESLDYDWKSGATTTSAIFNLRYEDEKANDWDAKKFNLTKDDKHMLDETLQVITEALKSYKPDKKWSIIYVSSDLCSFRKLFKGVRYQGYYVDRQQEEIMFLEETYPEYQKMWDSVWELRSKTIENNYLGEINGWNGIRKERMKLFLDKGYIGSEIDIK